VFPNLTYNLGLRWKPQEVMAELVAQLAQQLNEEIVRAAKPTS